MADSAEAAGHTDNLIEVARASRPWVRTQIELLRQWAAILRGERQGGRYDNLLTDAGVRRIAASDLRAIAKDLEAWIEHDWIAVIDISAERQYLEGPLPPFPGTARRGTQEPPPEEYANLSPETKHQYPAALQREARHSPNWPASPIAAN